MSRIRNYLHLARILLLLGVLGVLVYGGLFLGQGFDVSNDPIYDVEVDELALEYSVMLESGNDYRVDVRCFNEGSQAAVNGSVRFIVNGTEVHSKELYYKTDSYDSDMFVWDWAEYSFHPATDVNLTIVGELVEGQGWSIYIYQDESAYAQQQYQYFTQQYFFLLPLGIIAVLVGYFLFKRTKKQMRRLESDAGMRLYH
ncbi:MAG: hypothetical protein RTU30_05165 [Candidatus Thorarchaeota archaeon]